MTFSISERKWRSLLSYDIYRVFSLFLLVGLWLSNYRVHGLFPLLLLTIGYGLFSGLAFLIWHLKQPKFYAQVLISGIIDIVTLSLYVSFLDQLQSGLGVLINVNVAILSLLVPGRLAIFFAAIASSMLLIICSMDYLFQADVDSSIFFYSGIHGAGLFGTAIVAWYLAERLQFIELLAMQRGSQLADMQKINQYIVEKLKAGVLYVNQDGTIEVINSAAREMFNCLEKKKSLYLHELSPQLGLNFSHYLEHSKGKPYPYTAILKSQSLRVQYIPTTKGNTSNYLIILEDIHFINQQAQQLKLASLGRFTASVAHELRNPLGAISHAVQLMGNNGLNAEDTRLQRLIEKHCNRMNEVVKNVLQLSRREKAKPEQFDLIQFLEDFTADYRLYQRCQFDIDTSSISTSTVYFDRSQLEQILIILCDNAVKHNRDVPDMITVTFRVEEDDNKISLYVIDNGKGIDEAHQSQLFEPFFSTDHAGHGMGLYIARELAEINDAKLRYDSSIRKGCCFKIEFGNKGIEYYE